MQHGHQRLPSPQLSTPASQQPESQRYLSAPPQYSPSSFIPPSQHHSQLSSFQTTFPAPPSSHLINDPTPHSSSRRSIPSPLPNQHYQSRFPSDFTPPQSRNHYPPYPSHTNDPFFHQSHYPTNDTSLQPSCGPMIYMHNPPPTHAPYYPYHAPASIPVHANHDQLHQHAHPTNTMVPPVPGEPAAYQKSHHTHQSFPADTAVRPLSSARAQVFRNENTVDPKQSHPSNLPIVGNRSKAPDNFKPLASLPPLRSPPSRVTSPPFYPSAQGMQNMSTMVHQSRSVLSTVPYHPSTYISPSIPGQNLQQVADTGHFYNNPYQQNVQGCFPSEQQYQPTPANNLQWQTHLAPAARARSDKDGGDDRIGYPSYYVGPDGVTRYFGQQGAPRKKRLQWTPELHAKFVKAVEEFGVETAVPKLLLQAMNVPGLTRENVASHLQKYRESVRKKKLEIERSKSGMKIVSKESERARMLSEVESKNEESSGEKVEVEANKDKSSSERLVMAERADSTKRLRDIEWETGQSIINKRQKTVSNTQESEVVEGTELTEQEVESYARVRARVNEALQLQTSRGS